MSMKNYNDTSWDRNFLFLAQHINHCATAVPGKYGELIIMPANGRWVLAQCLRG